MRGPVIIVFGITGDLSRRKLLPALYHLLSQNLLPEDTKIVGLSRGNITNEGLLSSVELCVLEKDKVCDPEGLRRVQAALHTLQLDTEDAHGFVALKQLLESFDTPGKRDRLYYMSVPADAYGSIVRQLADSGLNDEHSKLLVEKPFGHDLPSAQKLLDITNAAFDETQVYRIDHYLAKETAQNILAFRLHNPIFMPLWNAEHIKRVHIRALETIGIEGRASFYEQTGALRDIVQSHLLQLLAVTLMDAPAETTSDAIHASKQAFLEQFEPADTDRAIRAQYDGYKSEANNQQSTIETYVHVQLTHASDRWRGTEITLETGKALHEKTTTVEIEFKAPHEARHNTLTFKLQPDEGIDLSLLVKEPGYENRMRSTALGFQYAAIFDKQQHIDAYERVLMDAVRQDQALFASDREITETWRILQPLLDDWRGNDKNLHRYQPGSDPRTFGHDSQ
jgi:glucose-6-phosphate 1-dehydrogenase